MGSLKRPDKDNDRPATQRPTAVIQHFDRTVRRCHKGAFRTPFSTSDRHSEQHEEAIGAPWFGTSAPSVAGQSGITPQVDMEHLFG